MYTHLYILCIIDCLCSTDKGHNIIKTLDKIKWWQYLYQNLCYSSFKRCFKRKGLFI